MPREAARMMVDRTVVMDHGAWDGLNWTWQRRPYRKQMIYKDNEDLAAEQTPVSICSQYIYIYIYMCVCAVYFGQGCVYQTHTQLHR